jgi:sulfur carrier protein
VERLGFRDSFGMKLTLNGQVRDVESGATLSDLLASLQLAEKMVLVELNGQAVQRADFPATKLDEADAIEIVRMVGGG